MMLSQAVEPYLTYCRVEKLNAPQTLQKYRDCFNAWITPILGQIEIAALTRSHVGDCRERMLERKLSVARQYSLLMALKTFLLYCREVLKVECLDPREIVLPDRGSPHVAVLTPEEIRRLLAALNPSTYSGARLRALIEVILATGMRISEVLSLDRDVFDRELEETEIVGKGKKIRTVFFNPRCQFWVSNYLNKRHDDHLAAFVTTGYEPRRLSRDDMSRFFAGLKQKAGIEKKATPHIFRHTYCTTLRDNGADISLIKELAGHADINTTATYYLGVDKKQLRRTVNKYLDYGWESNGAERAAA